MALDLRGPFHQSNWLLQSSIIAPRRVLNLSRIHPLATSATCLPVKHTVAGSDKYKRILLRCHTRPLLGSGELRNQLPRCSESKITVIDVRHQARDEAAA